MTTYTTTSTSIHGCTGNPCTICGRGTTNSVTFVDACGNVTLTDGTWSPLTVNADGTIKVEHANLSSLTWEEPLTVQDTKKFIQFLKLMNDDAVLAEYLTSSYPSDREIGKLITEYKDADDK